MDKIKDVIIFPNQTIKNAMKMINNNGLGSLIVVNSDKKILGILTDGIIRRAIFSGKRLDEKIINIFSKKIVKFKENFLTNKELYNICFEKSLSLIPISNKNGILVDFFTTKKKNYQKKKIQTVIMAGGLGTRMKPFTDIFPKPMLPINNKTMVEIVIEQFKNFNLTDFIFTINYKSNLLFPYLKNLSSELGIKCLIVKEKMRLGTAGCLKNLKNKINNDFFVTNCDTIIKADLNQIYDFHLKNKNDLTIVGAVKNIVIPYGVIKVKKNNMFLKIFEKPSNTYIINTGLYVLSPKIIDVIPKKNEIFDMTTLIEVCKNKNKKIKTFLIDDDEWQDVGQFDSYNKYIADTKFN